MQSEDILVIGAGPAGLAASASLRREGLNHVVLEREGNIGSAWRRHCDRLHLPTGFLCRRGHPLAGRTRLRVDDLMAYPIASTTISDQVARGMVERFGADAHPDRFVTLCCEEISHLLNVVVRSDAIYLGVLLGARTLESSGKLVRLPFDTKGFDATFGLVRLGGRTEPLMLPALRQLASEVLVDARPATRVATRMASRRRTQQ